ncbi:hypothetical protein AB0O91_26160 [Kitasatospora sp. NPDC089797]|uniref:hypothetical protein n=1 Tax=Kitasatospora sp. NPDC089797 TaxID=3155298 RepID=UPI00342B82A3
MLGEILGVLTAAMGPTPTESTRSPARLFRAGRVLVSEGCVLGDRPYCRPGAAFLHLSLTALAVSPDREADVRARPLPVGGLEPVAVRKRRPGDPAAVRRHWDVIECRDGGEPVLIGCEPFYTAYIRRVLQSDGA